MKPIARFVTRPHNDTDASQIDLILGNVFKGKNPLKPGHVYQIEEYLGDLVIKDKGEAAIKMKLANSIGVCWGHSINEIVESGNYFMLTDQEYNEILRKEREEREETSRAKPTSEPVAQ